MTQKEISRLVEVMLDKACAQRADLLAALQGCAAALTEAGKDFALASPLAARPNLYELHADAARAAIAKATGNEVKP